MTLHVIAIVGPTAGGKTHLGVEAAHRIGSEIISADSRQVYRGLDIGTGKDLEEYARVDPPVSVHLIDVADPEEVYTLFRYQEDCYEILRDCAARHPFDDRGTPVFLVGGSGLYVEAIVRDYRIADVPFDRDFRSRFEGVSREILVERLRRESPEVAAETDLSNSRRVIRGLEIAEYAKTREVVTSRPPGVDLRFTVFGLRFDRHELNRRIARRLRRRLEGGMIEEVEGLLERGLGLQRMAELGLEYREVAAYLEGRKDRARMVVDLESAICRFAKRQQTWFRGMERRGVPVRWIGAGDLGSVIAAAGIED